MNWQIFKQIYSHSKLSEKRSAAFEQNKSARYVIYGLGIFIILYLIFIAVMLALIANNSRSITGIELISGLLPFLLAFDFLARFAAQQTPSQLVKPYLLLPIPRHTSIDCYLLSSMLSKGNWIWHALYVPFSIMSILPHQGLWVALIFLLGMWLIEVINSQWYLLVRSLINISYAWWLLPLAVYGLVAIPAFTGKHVGIEHFFNFYSEHILTSWAFIGIPLVLVVLFLINRHVQYFATWNESAGEGTEKTALNARMSFLDKYGESGQYMRIELRSIVRCKNIRKSVTAAVILVFVFALLLSFTSFYDNPFMTSFWLIYCYVIFGAMILSRVMCYEGNYIDCLMVHHNNIFHLLRAKYILYGSFLLVTFLLLMPTVFTGKCTIFALIAYGLFVAGPLHILLLQMAVYNKQTMPLNTKFVGKGTMENNWMQVVIQLFVFFVPIFFIRVMHLFFSDVIVYSILSAIGLAFIITNGFWIRNIYQRMMVRRYSNMEGLRASRD
ncbi:MAG: hypothetical protein IJJ68_09480 [Prevotella sp.]|nr:hypothetical protein [Prevotella sp.]